MFISRAVVVAALIGAGSPSFAAEDANPFAKWDQLRKQTSVVDDIDSQKSASSKSKSVPGALEYFSAHESGGTVEAKPGQAKPGQTEQGRPLPSVDEFAAGEASPKTLSGNGSTTPPAQTVAEPKRTASVPSIRQERLRRPALTPGESTGTGSETHGDRQTSTNNEALPTDASGAPSGAAAVKRAAFVEAPHTGTVHQVSGRTGTAENPFAEFLLDAGQLKEHTSPAIPEVNSESPFDTETVPVPHAASTGKTQERQSPGTGGKAEFGPQTPSVTLQWVHKSDFNIGQECRCDLVVENTGTGAVRNVVVEAVLPEGLEVIDAHPAPTAAQGSATWTFGELGVGQKRTVELTFIPHEQGDAQVDAFVRITGSSSSTLAIREPRVAIRLNGPTSVEVGQQVNYTVQVTNPGTGEARNVVIQAAVPDGLEHRHGKLLTIEIGTLNPGEFRQARLSLSAVKGGENALAVRVLADGGLTEQTIETVSVAEPRLNIGIRGPASRMTGQPCDYELVVVNEGNVQSSNVRAKYKVPTGFEFVSAD
ncbi:MAG: DUF11 domain-containing protein, partial [Planctomycetaceae bacterium]|nr:DUF11 domain-containing protein [Planctomycetaceae bacterium]